MFLLLVLLATVYSTEAANVTAYVCPENGLRESFYVSSPETCHLSGVVGGDLALIAEAFHDTHIPGMLCRKVVIKCSCTTYFFGAQVPIKTVREEPENDKNICLNLTEKYTTPPKDQCDCKWTGTTVKITHYWKQVSMSLRVMDNSTIMLDEKTDFACELHLGGCATSFGYLSYPKARKEVDPCLPSNVRVITCKWASNGNTKYICSRDTAFSTYTIDLTKPRRGCLNAGFSYYQTKDGQWFAPATNANREKMEAYITANNISNAEFMEYKDIGTAIIKTLQTVLKYQMRNDCILLRYVWTSLMDSLRTDPTVTMQRLGLRKGRVYSYQHQVLSSVPCRVIDDVQTLKNPQCSANWPVMVPRSNKTYYLKPTSMILSDQPGPTDCNHLRHFPVKINETAHLDLVTGLYLHNLEWIDRLAYPSPEDFDLARQQIDNAVFAHDYSLRALIESWALEHDNVVDSLADANETYIGSDSLIKLYKKATGSLNSILTEISAPLGSMLDVTLIVSYLALLITIIIKCVPCPKRKRRVTRHEEEMRPMIK